MTIAKKQGEKGSEKRLTPSEEFNQPFPTTLRGLLRDRKVTQTALAEYLGVKRQSVGYWQNGDTSPDINILTKMAGYFNVSADYLLGLTDIKTPDTDIQTICEKTGLSEEAVNHLITNKALMDRILMNFEEREIKILTDTNKANDFISRLIISKSISSISYKLKEVQLERTRTKERQEDINRKRKEIFIKLQTATDELRDDLIEDEMELLHGSKLIASEYNETATLNRMITADDYESYLLNDITTTFRKLIEDILNEEAGASCETPIP